MSCEITPAPPDEKPDLPLNFEAQGQVGSSSDTEIPGSNLKYPSLWLLLTDQARVDEQILNYKYRGQGTDEDPFIITWIGGDIGNPLNWPRWLRWTITMTAAVACFGVAFSSSAYTGIMVELMVHFKSSETLTTSGVSFFVLGFALGPLLWAPLSEMHGRQVIFIISYGGYTIFSAACTADNGIATLLALRFFAGAFGSSILTNAGGVISDIWAPDEQTIAMAAFSLALAMGPTFGPFVGGFLGSSSSWRWVMGLMAILAAVVLFLGIILLPETYTSVLLRKRAQVLSRRTGKVFKTQFEMQGKRPAPSEILRQALSRPLVLLFMEPIVLILSIYIAILYGTLYLLFGAYPVVFQIERGWSPGVGGLAFLGIAVGMFAAVPVLVVINRWYVAKVRKHGSAPEYRLPGSMIGGIALPIGMFWFSWTSYRSIHWFSPVAAGVPFGLGMTLVFTSVFGYLVDSYTIYSASALAANAVLRSSFGAAFPLFTRQMYNNLGTQWASSVPAFLALSCMPMPFILWKYGYAIRRRCKYAAEAAVAVEHVSGESVC